MSWNSLITRRNAALSLLASVSSRAFGAPSPSWSKWMVYYGSTAPTEAFEDYSFLIFDSRYHPAVEPLAQQQKKIIGYISLGEASKDYSYFERLRAAGLLVRPSANWPGNQFIDIRDKRWKELLLNELVPAVLAKGFHGLFLDTLDNPIFLEETDPVRFRGMTSAAAEVIREIRRRNSGIILALNRGYKLLPLIDDALDVTLGESVFTTFDFQRKKYGPVETSAYKQQVEWLRAAQKRRPKLKVFTLDYADPADSSEIKRIYAAQRANGFAPYVASIDLALVVPEPR